MEGPPIGWVKINIDGAFKDGNTVGCGGLIRGSESEWLVGFFKKFRKSWKVSGVRNIWDSL